MEGAGSRHGSCGDHADSREWGIYRIARIQGWKKQARSITYQNRCRRYFFSMGMRTISARWISHGGSMTLQCRYQKKKILSIIEILDGADHGDAAFETDENMERIADFLDQYLK